VLGSKGVEADKIYYDKFTESGKVEGEEAKEESGPGASRRGVEVGNGPAGEEGPS
jgi:hypothetical protein